MIKFLIWNVHGIGNQVSIRRLKKLCRLHSLVTLVLIEPFISADRIVDIKSKLGFSECMAVDSNKIWVFWNSLFSFRLLSQFDQYAHLHGSHLSLSSPKCNWTWFFEKKCHKSCTDVSG